MRRTAINWGVRFVPQQEAYVIERFGKFSTVLEAGLHVLIPLVDRIAYIHSLKEQTIEIPEQPAVTTDNVSIRVNGVLFVKVSCYFFVFGIFLHLDWCYVVLLVLNFEW